MSSIASAIGNIRLLEDLSSRNSPVHNLRPLTKLLTTLSFVIVTVSFGKYEFNAMIPLLIYPVTLMALGHIPAGPVLGRILILAPLAVGIGVFNPFFDRAPLVTLPWIQISGGWVSFAVIIMKFLLTVSAGILLAATTGTAGIASALRALRIPAALVTQFALTMRYLSLFLEECGRVTLAHSLRSPGAKGVHFRAWGSLLGQALVRACMRAQRVYDAMLCRSFDGSFQEAPPKHAVSRWKDILFFSGFTLFFIAARIFSIPAELGAAITGLFG